MTSTVRLATKLHLYKMLARLIVKGHVQEAMEIVNAEGVRTVPVSAVDSDFIGENVRVMGQILRIKKAATGKRKMVMREGGQGKMLKLEQPYDRLVFWR